MSADPASASAKAAAPIAIDCPACGAPLSLHTFSTVRHVVCAYCGSSIAPDEHGALRLVERIERRRQPTVLPLYARGTFDGIEFEIVGIVRRQCVVEGVAYPWQEFLLFNPYEGFRWLIHSESDGGWSLGEPLDGAPMPTGFGWQDSATLRYADRKYQHFQTVVAVTIYAEGEFPWQVRAGDKAVMHDFVAPPFGLSVEETQLEDGTDLAFTRTRHLDPDAVWRAFGRDGEPPAVSGVPPLAPNPHAATTRFLWRSLAVFLPLWLVMVMVYVGTRDTRTLLSRADVDLAPVAAKAPNALSKVQIFEPIVESVDLTTYDHPVPLEFRFTAGPLSNTWAFAEMMLVDENAHEAYGFSAEVDEWHGVSGGESWREGTQVRTIVLPAVPPGRYSLQIAPQAERRRDGTVTVQRIAYVLEADPVLHRYIWLPLPLLFLVPLWSTLRWWQFEVRRWEASDHPKTSSE